MSKRNAEWSLDDTSVKLQKLEEDGRLIFCSSPISLTKMAVIRVAISLWYHQKVRHVTQKVAYTEDSENEDEEFEEEEEEYYERRHFCGESHEYCKRCETPPPKEVKFTVVSLVRQVTTSLPRLNLPPAVAKMIENHFKPIGQAIDEWVAFVHDKIFYETRQEEVYRFVDEIIFQSNGEVDGIGTAKRMLLSPRINEIDKYRIICTYCMEDEINNVSPVLFSNQYFDRVRLQDHPLIYYFNCYATGEFLGLINGNDSIEKYMLTLKNVDYKHAILYFFNLLEDEDKVEVAKLLIRRYGTEYQVEIVNNLNEIQQNHVFLDMGVDIVINFARCSSMSEFALKTWIHVRNLATEGQFFRMVNEIKDMMFNDASASDCDSYFIPLLTAVWKNSPDYFKCYALKYEYNGHKMIDEFLQKNSTSYTFSEDKVEFLMELLRDTDIDSRREVIQSALGRTFCGFLIEKSHLALADSFIKFCLPEVNDALEFKGELLTTPRAEERCLQFCIQRNISELKSFVSFHLQDPSAASNYLIRLLTSENGVRTYINNSYRIDIISLRTSITEIIPDGDAVKKFLRAIALSKSITQKFSAWIMIGDLNKAKDCVSQLLSDQQDVQAVKNVLLSVYQGERITELFGIRQTNSHYCRDFLLWCLNNEQNITLQFKSTLPLAKIFIKMLKYAVFSNYDYRNLRSCKVRNDINFTALNEFLLWYFVTFEEVKKFKLAQVFGFQKIEIIDILSKKTDKSGLGVVMDWFFDGDVHQMRKFQSVNRRSRAGKVLNVT